MAGRPSPEDQRERILGCTEILIARRGFEKVRLRDVAKAAEVSIGSLQHHFETRDGLLREAFVWSAQRRLERWQGRAADGCPPWLRLVELLIGPYLIEHFREDATIWLEFAAAASREPDLQTTMSNLYDRWRAPIRETIEAGLDAGVFSATYPVDVIVDILTTQIDGSEVASSFAAAGTERSRLCYLTVVAAEALLGVDAEQRVSQEQLKDRVRASMEC